MSTAAKRTWIVIAGIVLLLAVLVVCVLALAGPLGCEDAEEETLNTVLCDPQASEWWGRLQGAIMLALIGACIAALVIGVRRVRFLPIGLCALAAVPAFIAVNAIYGIEVKDRPAPYLTGAKVLSRTCVSPCARGFAVKFTIDKPARVQISLSAFAAEPERLVTDDYALGLEPVKSEEGFDSGYHFEPGSHVIRVNRRVEAPPELRGPALPGKYSLLMSVEPEHEGNIAVKRSDYFNPTVRILPPR